MFKRLSLIVLLLLQFFCISAKLQNAATQQSEQRKTSKPYTGDLSIFDSPGRDERLQINRVMDILGIAPGKTVADKDPPPFTHSTRRVKVGEVLSLGGGSAYSSQGRPSDSC